MRRLPPLPRRGATRARAPSRRAGAGRVGGVAGAGSLSAATSSISSAQESVRPSAQALPNASSPRTPWTTATVAIDVGLPGRFERAHPCLLEDRLHGAEQACGDAGTTQCRGRARHAGKRGRHMIAVHPVRRSGPGFRDTARWPGGSRLERTQRRRDPPPIPPLPNRSRAHRAAAALRRAGFPPAQSRPGPRASHAEIVEGTGFARDGATADRRPPLPGPALR